MKIKFNTVKTSSILNSKQSWFDWKVIHELLTNGDTNVQASKGVGFDPVGATAWLFKGEILTANSEKNRSHTQVEIVSSVYRMLFLIYVGERGGTHHPKRRIDRFRRVETVI